VSEFKNEDVDIGIIDYKNIQLSGNLPISINGEPLAYDDSSYANMYIYQNIPNSFVVPANIQLTGDWSIDAYVPASTEALQFRVMAVKNGGKFRQDLIPDNAITIPNTGQEVFFPSYPNIDFKALTISGTVKLTVDTSTKNLYSYSIRFIDTDLTDPYNYSNYPFLQNAWDNRVATVYEDKPQTGDGLYYWETLIPEFSFPHNLIFNLYAGLVETAEIPGFQGTFSGDGIISNVTVADAAGLNTINLGTFSVKRRYFKEGAYSYGQDYIESVVANK